MPDKKYETLLPESYQKFPRLISGLKEMCLVKLIEINPLKNKIALVQRERDT